MWMLIVCSCFCCGPGLRDPLSFDQAAILANGDWVADGFRISDYPADGPLANLERHVGGTQYRGIADPGDTITRINGNSFAGRDEFLRLLNDSYRERSGTAILTIRDVRTNELVDWQVRLVLTRGLTPSTPAAAPRKRFSLLDQLGPRPERFQLP